MRVEYCGGRRTGKSTWLVQQMLDYCLDPFSVAPTIRPRERKRRLVVCITRTRVESDLLREYLHALDESEEIIRSGSDFVVFKNGAEIVFLTAHLNGDNTRGLNPHAIAVDNLDYLPLWVENVVQNVPIQFVTTEDKAETAKLEKEMEQFNGR